MVVLRTTPSTCISSDTDFVNPRPNSCWTGGIHVGKITAGSTEGDVTHSTTLPYVLAPVPQVGTGQKLTAFYVPKGKNLWAARQTSNLTDAITNAPLLGVQGNFY